MTQQYKVFFTKFFLIFVYLGYKLCIFTISLCGFPVISSGYKNWSFNTGHMLKHCFSSEVSKGENICSIPVKPSKHKVSLLAHIAYEIHNVFSNFHNC